MVDERATVEARRFLRSWVFASWGYMVRKKWQERTAQEETIVEAQSTYWRGIKDAWLRYTEGNETVKQAQDELLTRRFKKDPSFISPKTSGRMIVKNSS